MVEREVKFLVEDFDLLTANLRTAGAALVTPEAFEKNLRFDTPDGELTTSYQVLRLRKDDQIRLTYKGPGASIDGVMARREIEISVDDFDAAKELLEALGFQINWEYEKYRATYHLNGVEIVLDRTPIGRFVELEGPDSATLAAIAERLGLNWDARIGTSYASLFHRLKSILNLDFRDLTFENFANIRFAPTILGIRPAINSETKT